MAGKLLATYGALRSGMRVDAGSGSAVSPSSGRPGWIRISRPLGILR